jgi:hypothetical protein
MIRSYEIGFSVRILPQPEPNNVRQQQTMAHRQSADLKQHAVTSVKRVVSASPVTIADSVAHARNAITPPAIVSTIVKPICYDIDHYARPPQPQAVRFISSFHKNKRKCCSCRCIINVFLSQLIHGR